MQQRFENFEFHHCCFYGKTLSAGNVKKVGVFSDIPFFWFLIKNGQSEAMGVKNQGAKVPPHTGAVLHQWLETEWSNIWQWYSSQFFSLATL